MKHKLLLTMALAALTSLPAFAGSYYGALTAKSTATAKGLVYASTSSDTPDDSDYTNSITTDTSTGSSADMTFYAFAKAARGYAFSSWTAGSNTTVGANTGSADAITVSASSKEEDSPTAGTVTANWTALTGYTISYQAPTNGTYTVTYSYTAVENNAFTTATDEYSLTPVSDTQAVTSYTDDVVTLSTTRDDFEGWYTVSDDTEMLLSTDNPYTYTVSADATITAKFSGTTSDNVASVTSDGTTTNYATLAAAIAAANELGTNPTVTLLADVYDVTATQTISKSMTIDLNGHMVVGTASYTSSSEYFLTLIDINGSDIGVTITDSSTGGQLLMSGTQNRAIYGIKVTDGTLNITGGKVYAQNKYTYSSTYKSMTTYGVYVLAGATLNVSGGEIEADGSRNVYGIYANGSATATTTVKVTDGTITASADYSAGYAYGIYSYSDVSLSGGTINANSTTGTYAYGVYIGANTTDNYVGSLTMSDGTINATTKTTNSRGVVTYGTMNITGGTINATSTQYAYGVYAAAATNEKTGAKAEGEVDIKGGSINATTTSSTYAYGLYIAATSRSITSNASGYYPGYYTAAGSATISGGSISATTATTTAYGVHVGRSVLLNGQEIVATGRGELTITGGTITATSGTTTALGVNTYGPTDISGGTITAKTTTTGAYGVRVYDGTTTISGDATISATATATAYGVYAMAETDSKTGVKAEGVANISGGSISATTTSTTGAYGVYIASTSRSITSNSTGYYPGYYAAAGAATISGGSISATAKTTTAYTVYAAATSTNGTASATPTCTITGGDFAVSAKSTYANINRGASTDSVTISDGYYTDLANLSRYLLDGLYVYELESTHDKYAEDYRYYISEYQDNAYVALNKSTEKQYTTLEKALDEASSGNTVVLINPYKLSAATTVPSGVTLLIPYDSSYTTETTEPETTDTFNINGGAYKTLTMLSGSSITVNGDICVGGVQLDYSSYDNGSSGAPGCVTGNYGCIDMSQGGTITLNSGANLYAWGYIVGQSMDEGDNTSAGTIVAESGANVYEDFVVADWPGGTLVMAMYQNRTSYKVFPFNQYFVPNIEVPLTIKYGATEYVHVFIASSSTSFSVEQSVSFIGSSSSFFTMADGCSVTKRYDPQTDRLHLDIDGDLTVNGISFSAKVLFSTYSISSSDFVLPITNNLYVKANSGTLTVPYDMAILPHSVVEIGENAKASISSGANVYVYDLDEWYKYAYGAYYRTYNYRPTKHLTHSSWALTDLEDGKLIVDGTLNVAGSLYTTSSGADICSTDAGTINFTTAPTDSAYTYQKMPYGETADYTATYTYLNNTTYTQHIDQLSVYAPWLHNEDDSYTKSAGSAAGTTFNYVGGYWITGSEAVTAYTPGDNTGTSKSFAEWKELQEGNYPNAVALYTGTDTTAIKIANKLPNIVVGTSSDDEDAVCANFVATDKQPINIPFEFTATTASYSRAATSYSGERQLGTICLPYAVSSDENIQFYELSSIDGNQMTFTEVTELAANIPALFSVATDADRTTVDIVAENATIPVTTEGTSTADGLTLNGVMTEAKTLTASSESTDYYIAQNMFWQPTTNNVTVNPFRAYFTSDGTANAAKYSIAIGDSDETTSVSSVFNSSDDEIEGVYGVNGIRRDTVQKGINIIRFKSGRTQKVLIK